MRFFWPFQDKCNSQKKLLSKHQTQDSKAVQEKVIVAKGSKKRRNLHIRFVASQTCFKVQYGWPCCKRFLYKGYEKVINQIPDKYYSLQLFTFIFMMMGLTVTTMPLWMGVQQVYSRYDLDQHPYFDPSTLLGSFIQTLPTIGMLMITMPPMLEITLNYHMIHHWGFITDSKDNIDSKSLQIQQPVVPLETIHEDSENPSQSDQQKKNK